MTPTADDLAEIADLQVAEALDAAESRGLVPPGWASDESRAWACVLCDGTGVAGWSPYGTAIQSACGACAVRVTLGSRIVTRGGDGTQRTPNTTDDLCAVLAIDWHRAEVLAREVVRELRQYGHRGGDVRVVWRVVKMEPCGEHDLISPTLRAVDRAEVWSGHVNLLHADGRRGVLETRDTWHMWGDGACGTGRADDRSERLPAARELVAMGLRLGRITDDAVTLVCPRK